MNNVLIMTGDFNIRDSNWDLSYPYHLIYSDMLREIADGFNLELSIPINLVSTRYIDNLQDLSSVLDLIFFWADSEEFNNHCISLDLYNLSNHTSLSVLIIIEEELIQERKQTIIKNSKEEKEFVNELKIKISEMDMTNILDSNTLESIT